MENVLKSDVNIALFAVKTNSPLNLSLSYIRINRNYHIPQSRRMFI